MNQRTKDRTKRWAGKALRESVESTAEYAERVERSQRTVQRWGDGRHPSWLTSFLEKLAKVDDVSRIVAHVTSFAKWRCLHGKPTAELVERYWSLTEMEHELEAAENHWTVLGTDMAEEALANEREAAIQSERAAVLRILDARNVNPRHYRRPS